MHLKFKHSLFPITLGQITILQDTVFISQPFSKDPKQRRMQIPLKRFYVRGLGQNSISLPFRLFQDLLFARMPQELFTRAADVKKTDLELQAIIKNKIEEYTYLFKNDRLSTLDYKNLRSGDKIHVSMSGKYKESVFPKKINLATNPGQKNSESMGISFRSLNLKATCSARHFPRF